MKKIFKIFSVLLAVILTFSTFSLMSNAMIADSSIEWTIKLEKVTTPGIIDDDSGIDATELGNIYKIVVTMNSTEPLNRTQVGVAYDADLFDMCYGDDSGNYLAFPCNDENGYTLAHKILGTLADDNAYDTNGATGASGPKVKAYGPSHASAKTDFAFEQIPSTDERWTNGVKWAYTDKGATPPANTGVFVGRYALNDGLSKGVVLPEGKQDIFEVYMMLKDGKTEADVNNTEMRFTLMSYSAASNPTQYGPLNCWMRDTVPDTVANYTKNGTVYVYNAGEPVSTSIVSPYKEQIRFDTNDDGTFAGTFDYRYLAQITAEDFTKTFGTETEALDKIQELGFIFASQKNVKPADFSMADAKALAESDATTSGNYTKKTVSYLSNKDGNYAFSCLVTDISEAEKTTGANVLAYVKYKDADGAIVYAYYDTVTSSTFDVLYDNAYDRAFPTV